MQHDLSKKKKGAALTYRWSSRKHQALDTVMRAAFNGRSQYTSAEWGTRRGGSLWLALVSFKSKYKFSKKYAVRARTNITIQEKIAENNERRAPVHAGGAGGCQPRSVWKHAQKEDGLAVAGQMRLHGR